ncbi:MAG: S1 RNA-binding domain-containing protein, partial [Planctomycetota bacterium]
MVDETLIASLQVSDADTAELLGGMFDDGMDSILEDQLEDLQAGKLIQGKIIGMAGDDVVVEVGLKSEGLINKEEFGDEEVRVGDTINVLLESLEGESGLIQLSKRKADRQIAWQKITDQTNEGDEVEGTVMRKIKGGLLVDIGVPVFLPASQVDIRRPGDVGEYIGRKIRAQILKIDTERRNIVISRRKLVEAERHEAKKRLLDKINVGDIVEGQVKNIADFGAFVDLG